MTITMMHDDDELVIFYIDLQRC